LLKIVGLEINIQGKGNIMPQLLRMMNPKEIRKVLLMRKKIGKNITWFLPYLVHFPRVKNLVSRQWCIKAHDRVQGDPLRFQEKIFYRECRAWG
jgi:hypothetical protein